VEPLGYNGGLLPKEKEKLNITHPITMWMILPIQSFDLTSDVFNKKQFSAGKTSLNMAYTCEHVTVLPSLGSGVISRHTKILRLYMIRHT